MLTNVLQSYRRWRMRRFLTRFQNHIKRYDAMMKHGGIRRRQRRRWKKQLVGAYEITVERLLQKHEV